MTVLIDASKHGPWCAEMGKKKVSTLADKIRKVIAESGLTPYQIAEESGVHRSQLSRFIRGERDLVLSAASKLCEVLGLDLVQVREPSITPTVPPPEPPAAPPPHPTTGPSTAEPKAEAKPRPRKSKPKGKGD